MLFIAMLSFSTWLAAEQSKQEWTATSLSDEVIEKIQKSQFLYKKCAADEMQKQNYAKLDSRHATDAVIKKCEPELAKMRQVYLDAKVPGVVADRHLKKMRIDITRRVLKQLMFAEAARKAGK